MSCCSCGSELQESRATLERVAGVSSERDKQAGIEDRNNGLK